MTSSEHPGSPELPAELQERLLRRVLELEERVESVERTLSYQLGRALIDAGSSPGGLMALPQRLREIRREARRRGKKKAESRSPSTPRG